MMTKEEYEDLLRFGSTNEDLAQKIAQQEAQAKYMRETFGAPPEMRHAGRVVKAPHWMELLGGLANQAVAKGQQDKATKSREMVTANKAYQNKLIMEAILRQQQAEAAKQMQPPVAGPGLNPAGGGEGFKIPSGTNIFGG